MGFLDAHGIEKTAIVGNSLGGRIALQMATDRPERISRMVLMGSPGVGMSLTEGLERCGRTSRRMTRCAPCCATTSR